MKSYTLDLPATIQTQLFEHAKEIAPIESCGYLGGKDGVVTTFYPMTNVDNSHEHFSFDPKEQFQAVKQARKAGESLIGVYHSHPETPARLSEEDIKLFNDPEPVYIIVSLKEDTPYLNGFKVFKPQENEIEIYKVAINVTKGDAS